MATVRKTIMTALGNSDDGTIKAVHSQLLAELRLEGCSRQALNQALTALSRSRKIRVTKTQTHTTIKLR